MKTLLTENRCRSLWQVVVLYVVGAALVYWVVVALTESVGLPSWTPALSFLLLLIAFPFTLAAAFVRDTDGDANPVAGIVAELHRRSLWQVMGIFLAGSWGALQVVEVLTETAGLPDWTPTMALVLILIGLPVCLATAFVQEGLPGRGDADGERTTSIASQGAASLFTWRNALLGAVGALALLGLSTGGYLVMWTMGIGPLGNLVAQGVISQGAQVVLSDFADASGEGLGEVVTEALRVDLLEASVLDLVEGAELGPTLAQMGVDAGAPLTADRAHEVAIRAGIPAAIEGEVASAGSGFIITATLRETESGQSLASFRVTASGPDDVIASIDKLSQDLRERSGESLRDIRGGKPLEQVTTGSLEALRLYTHAADAYYDDFDVPRTIDLLDRALALDSTFAMGWRLRGIAVQNGLDPSLYYEASAKAYEFRDRLQDRERYMVEAAYWERVVRDSRRAIEPYEALLAIDPDHTAALNNLALILRAQGRTGAADDLFRRAAHGPPAHTRIPSGVTVLNLVQMGRVDDAAEALRDHEATHPDDVVLPLIRFAVALVSGDVARAELHASNGAEDAAQSWMNRGRATAELARLALWEGRVQEARRLFLRAETLFGQESTSLEWLARVATAYEMALVGDTEWAREHAREGLQELFTGLPPMSRNHGPQALLLAMAGNLGGAEVIVQDWHAAIPDEQKGWDHGLMIQTASFLLRLERGDTIGVRESMEQVVLESGCVGRCWTFERARVFDSLGDFERAAEFYRQHAEPGFYLDVMPAGSALTTQLFALLRLGPLYEEMGDTTRAIEAYQRVVTQWADADERGTDTVRRFRARIAALDR